MGSRIELLCSLLLLICQIIGAQHAENTSCRLSLTVPLEKDKVHTYENGSLFYEDTLYPVHLYWTVDDTVRGCICELRPCLRKCCQDGEVLSDGEVSECIEPRNQVVTPELRLEKDQLAPEIQDIRSIADHFALVRNRICPYNKSYKLEPDNFYEDKFVLEKNGTLRVAGAIEMQWNFCIDWHESLKKVTVLKCHQPNVQTVSAATQTIYPIMTIVSVPFLIITFLVYAIIPELRNIYGKTLMCYVACLVTAYCSLINAQFKYLPPGICASIEPTTTPTEESPIAERKWTMKDYNRYCEPEGNCLSFCCPLGYYFLSKNKCEKMTNVRVSLPRIYTIGLKQANITTNDQNFRFLYWNPCEGGRKFPLDPSRYPEERFYLIRNGSFYLPYNENGRKLFRPKEYCLAVKKSVSEEYLLLYCEESMNDGEKSKSASRSMLLASLGMIASIPFLVVTFLVYSVLEELRNLHGLVLRGYVGSLAVAYAILSMVQTLSQERITNTTCVFLENALWCCLWFVTIVGTSSSLLSSESPSLSWNLPDLSNVSSSTLSRISIQSIPNHVGSLDSGCPDENTNPSCLPLCCTQNYRTVKNKCVRSNDTISKFPPVHDVDSFTPIDLVVDETNFRFFVRDPCNGTSKYKLIPEEYEQDEFLLLQNGSIYLKYPNMMIEIMEYCFGLTNQDQYEVLMCFEEESDEDSQNEIKIFYPIGLLISVPFLLATFIVYTILPQLNNMHGCTLRGYVGSLIVAYTFLAIVQMTPPENITDNLCIVYAFVIHFSFLASFFWLNIMCFDIWWTFGGFRALRGSVKQRDRKKFIVYSIYAWGSASVLTGICVIMDFAPNIPENFIRPKFGLDSCWFNSDAARAIYFYGPMGITVLCNICLFISTAIKIQKHKRDTAHHLKGSESRRHDDNKQWFNLYLKLFIVMGINWSMEIVSWLCNGSPEYVWYITDLANTLQGLIIFIIFVCKDKIKRLLLKRFGSQGNNILSRNSTRSVFHSSASRTCTTSTTGLPLREKISTHIRREPICTGKESAEESDCA